MYMYTYVFSYLSLVTGLTGDCTVDGFPTPDTNFQVNGASFPERNSTTGLQVLIPGAAFTCHGYITNWTALIANYFYRDVAFSIEAQIYFQLWRPDGQGKYRQIGNDVVAVTSQEITQETVDITNVRDVAQFIKLEERVAQGDTRMRFEPGDVLGYFSPGFIGPTLGADLTYRPSPEGSENSVDMFYVGTPRSTHDNQLCEISLCDDKVRKVTGIPQLSVAYGEKITESFFAVTIYILILNVQHLSRHCYVHGKTLCWQCEPTLAC